MTHDMRTLKDFLAGLTPDELTQTRDLINVILSNKQIRQQVETGKRPHVAMRERRGGNRYHVNVIGRGWDALKVLPTDTDKCGITMVDISSTGCSFTSETPYHPSQILSIECRPPQGKEKKIFVEVIRARRIPNSRPLAYDIGCRALDETHIAQAREFIAHQISVRTRLDDHPSIHILQLIGGADCQEIHDYLRRQEYDAQTITSSDEIITAATTLKPDTFLCPASAITGKESGWLNEFRSNFPDTPIIALSPSVEECGRVRALGIEHAVIASKGVSEIRVALERALYNIFIGPAPGLKPTIKIMIAGRDEKNTRKLQTLVLEKKYLVSKCPSPDAILHELEMQEYHALIAAAELLSKNHYEMIDHLRRLYPFMAIIVDTDDPAEAQEALGKDADLILPTSATRAELGACLQKVQQVLFSRTFVR